MKKLIFIIVILITITKFTYSQVIYYQFEGGSYLPTGGLCPSCSLTTVPGSGLSSSSTTPFVDDYLDFSLPNGVLSTGSIPTLVTTAGVTIQMLVNLDPIYGLQRKNTLFTLENGTQTISAHIEYSAIKFTTTNSSGDSHTMLVRLGGNGSQSWDYYVNPTRASNWHMLTFVYSGDNSTPGTAYKKIYIDGLLPGDYAGGSSLISTSFHVVDANVDADLTNSDIIGSLDRIIISGAATVDQIKGYYDEFIIYPTVRTSAQIYNDYLDASGGSHYSFGTYAGTLPIADVSGPIDIDEYPLNYSSGNDYSLCASPIDQLQSFPIARFKEGHKLLRNVNWAKCSWMSGIIGTGSASPTDVEMAIDIQNELAENWNYYYNFTENASSWSGTLSGTVDVTTDLNVAYIDDINSSGKDYPLAGLLYRAQLDVTNHPSSNYHNCTNISGYTGGVPNPFSLIRSPSLEDSPISGYPQCTVTSGSLYPRDNSNNRIYPGGVNSPAWSPLSTNRTIYKDDGVETARIINEFKNSSNSYWLTNSSVQRIKMLSENNEIVRPYSNSLLEGITVFHDDRILVGIDDVGLSNVENMKLYQSFAKSNIDNDYRQEILTSGSLGLNNDVIFMNYAVDGHDNSRFAYHYYRETQTLINGQPYTTPDIYMQKPAYWYVDDVGGDNHGWQFLARARNTELIKDEFDNPWNDKWTAPYVSAGWDANTEEDMRPGQYLGILKSVALTGANFFHPGYFLNNPPGAGSSYCWQVSTPVYAQALNSRLYDFIDKGVLLYGDYPWNLAVTNPAASDYKTAFRFNTEKPNELVVARKMNDEEIYAITGTVQSTSGYDGTFELETEVNIDLKANSVSPPVYSLTFPIRRQGSTYIYDYTDEFNPAFWQIDKWHQYEHPERWSKDFVFEAEVLDNLEANCTKFPMSGIVIKTEDNGAPHTSITNGDYTDFTSYIGFETPAPLEYRFQPRNVQASNDYTLFVNARTLNNSGEISGLSITLTDLTDNSNYGSWKINCVTGNTWQWYGVNECDGDPISFDNLERDHEYMLTIVPMNAELELDQIYIAHSGSAFSPTVVTTGCYNSYTFDVASSGNAFSIFSSTSISNAQIRVQAGVVITVNYSFIFDDCLFTMEDGAQIVVSTNNTLTLINCNFSTCSDMWTGITSVVGGTIVLDRSSLQDAYRAVDFTEGDLDIDNTLFDKNLESVYMTECTSTVDESVFDCSGILKDISSYEFTDSHIISNYTELDVVTSDFRNSNLGIRQGLSGSLLVSGSKFNRNLFPVFCYPDIKSVEIEIDNNQFTCKYENDGAIRDETWAISVWGTISVPVELKVSNNTITDFNIGVLGMSITGGNTNYVIENNSFTLNLKPDQTDYYQAISLLDCNYLDINSNSINWTKNDNAVDYSDLTQGISIQDCRYGEIKENYINELGAAIRTFDNCQDYDLYCNTMVRCFNGVYLDPNGAANKLTDQGNWTGSISTSETWNNHWVDMQNPNEYNVDGTVAVSHNFDWTYYPGDSEYEPSIPTILNTYINIEDCSLTVSTCSPPNVLARGGSFETLTAQLRDEVYGDAVGDSIFYNSLDEAFLYNAKLEFLRSARKDSSILYLGYESDSTYISEFDSLNSSNMGILEDAMEFIVKEEFQEASEKLNQITEMNTIESNLAFALEVYSKKYSQGVEPDSITIIEMNAIANQHPFFGGKGVYIMRSMLHRVIHDFLPEQRIKQLPNSHDKNMESIMGKLYPNPATKQINYVCHMNEGKQGQFILKNSLGSTVLNQQVFNNNNVFEIGTLSNGIYYYTVNVDYSIVDKGKLIIHN